MRDYLAGEGSTGEYFPGSPFSPEAYRRKWDEVRRRFGREERERAAGALRPTSARAEQRLRRFVEEGGAVVTTGQQAGLFSGPLYTVHKALSVVRLADSLERELGGVVLPVFWSASEDHDWAEVNHAHLLGEADGVRRLELDSADARALPMSDRRLGDEVRTVLDETAQLLRGQPFADGVLALLREAYQPGRTVADAFTATLSGLFAPFDLLLTDAADPQLKRASVPVLREALLAADRHEEILRRRSEQLVRDGYHAQVVVPEQATNVFYQGTGERERLYREGRDFALRDSGQVLERERLLERLEVEPRIFSPNVFLRPVVESAVFPTLAYVAGPGEISYFAQITALFPEFGMEPPVVAPRVSVLLVERAAGRLMEKLALSPADLARPPHEIATEVARRAVPAGVRAGLDDLERALLDGYRRLIDEASRLDPTLGLALGSLRNESLANLGAGERKILQRIKQHERSTLAQVERARAQLAPGGEPQERVLNVAPFLARHGFGLLAEILAAMQPAAFSGLSGGASRPLPDLPT